jgi:hypothetical protein
MKRHIPLWAAGVALVACMGCTKRMLVPPRVHLDVYDTVGLVLFSSNTEGSLEEFASQKFIESIQLSQPNVRILELGPEEQLLESIQRDRLDYDAVRTIGRKFNVEAVLTGHMDVTEVKPKVGLTTLLSSLSVKADVEASLTTRLYDSESGATLWTNSARGKQTVAHVGLISGGGFHFGASDPDDAYGELVHGLVFEVTRDFRVRYAKQ